MISVLILTHNEAKTIEGCIASVAWSDDVVVLDSHSTDETVPLAERAGARIFRRRFDDYAAQRNYGLSEIPFRHEWVLMLDADERATRELHDELRATLPASAGCSLFHFRRKDIFLGRWIKRSSGYPIWLGRVVRRGEVRVERAVNEIYTTAGQVGFLDGHILHFPFAKGVAQWIDRHNRYSTLEASVHFDELKEPLSLRSLLTADPVERRRALKRLSYRLPFRPLCAFLFFYILRGGFVDGAPGLYYCALKAFYELMIVLKIREMQKDAA